jgi:drug/metabolite transporter (DMT)-like permease
VFAFFAQNWALRHSSPSRVALLTGTEPVWGALFALAWLGESLTPLQWAGAAVVVGATVWATRRQG